MHSLFPSPGWATIGDCLVAYDRHLEPVGLSISIYVRLRWSLEDIWHVSDIACGLAIYFSLL